MRVFATLWKETDSALRGRSVLPTAELSSGPPVPFPGVLPPYRASSLEATPSTSALAEQLDAQQAETLQLHRAIKERDEQIAALQSRNAAAVESTDVRVLLKQIKALETIGNELRSENDELAKENATYRSGGTVSSAMVALTKRYESLRITKNRLQVDITAVRKELAEQATSRAVLADRNL